MQIQKQKLFPQYNAFIGAIMKGEGIVYWELQQGAINTNDFILFSKRLFKKYPEDELPILYLDNLSVHHSNKSKDVYDEEGWGMAFAPIYSSEFNPIGKKVIKFRAVLVLA